MQELTASEKNGSLLFEKVIITCLDKGWANYGPRDHLSGPPALAKTSLIVLIKHVT